ncbi:MAG: CarD family transcriptional regulator [Anaerovoracaceae bacterium]|jgi:CarD family transcriptional regulator
MYNIGDKIVYPMHGAGVIEEIENKEILGEMREYYVLKVPCGDMKIMIPVDKSDEIGVRNVISQGQMDDVVEILQGPSTEMSDNWNRRHRENMEKLKTGEVTEVAEVVRNLLRLEEEKHLSTGEKKMLTNARQILQSELILAGDMDQAEAEKLIIDAVCIAS